MLEIKEHPLCKTLRDAGKSKLWVAGITGINPPRVYQLLNGQARPSMREAMLLASVAKELEAKAE